jgi:hypothetical protein
MYLQYQYRSRGFARLLFRVVLTATVLAILAAALGAAFGALSGLAFWVRYGEVGILAGMIARCAMAGALAGAIVGALGRLLDGEPHQAHPTSQAWRLARSTPRNGAYPVDAAPPWSAGRGQERFRRSGGPRFTG